MYWASIRTADLCDLHVMTFERLEALLGWNNSLVPASTYYSQNYSRIIGTGLVKWPPQILRHQVLVYQLELGNQIVRILALPAAPLSVPRLLGLAIQSNLWVASVVQAQVTHQRKNEKGMLLRGRKPNIGSCVTLEKKGIRI